MGQPQPLAPLYVECETEDSKGELTGQGHMASDFQS